MQTLPLSVDSVDAETKRDMDEKYGICNSCAENRKGSIKYLDRCALCGCFVFVRILVGCPGNRF